MPVKLSPQEITDQLATLSEGWSIKDAFLHKGFKFQDFSEAFAFMTRIAMYAESVDHHPDWSNVYNQVTINLSTHSAGGLTQLDFQFALKVDEITLKV